MEKHRKVQRCKSPLYNTYYYVFFFLPSNYAENSPNTVSTFDIILHKTDVVQKSQVSTEKPL